MPEYDIMRIDGVAHRDDGAVSLEFRDIVSPAPSVAGTVNIIAGRQNSAMNRVSQIILDFNSSWTTQCVRDQLVALATMGRPFPLQIDRDWSFENQRLIRIDANTYRTELAPIRPPDTDSGTSPALYVWEGEGLLSVDGNFGPGMFTVDWRNGIITFEDPIAESSIVQLSYCYTPVVVVHPDGIDLAQNPALSTYQPDDEFDLYADNAPVYSGLVRLTPVFPADETLRRRTVYSGCFEFEEGEEWGDDEVIEPSPISELIPPYPAPAVAYRNIYAPHSRWDTVRTNPTYVTSSLASDIPAGNVIAGVEVHRAKGLTWGRSSTNTLRILASYRLDQAIPVTRTFTKSSQPGGVYDHATLNNVDLLTRTVMGEYYDNEWPNRFGRASNAEHRGTISGGLEIQAPDLTTNTLHPLEEAGSEVSGKSIAFWRDPPDGELIYTSPIRHIQSFMDLTRGRYWYSAAWRFQEARPGIGVMPSSFPYDPAWDVGYTYGAMKNLPLAQETRTTADIAVTPRIWWRGESAAPNAQVYVRAFSVVRADLVPSGPASANDFVQTTGATSPVSIPVIGRTDNILEDRLNDTGWVSGSFNGTKASMYAAGGGIARRVHPTNTIPPTNTSSGVGLYIGGAVEIWDHFESSQLAIYHGAPVSSRPSTPGAVSWSGAGVTLSVITNQFGARIIRLTAGAGGSGTLTLNGFSGFTTPVPDLWVCGWRFSCRAKLTGGTPVPIDAQIRRDGAGTHTAAPGALGTVPPGATTTLSRGGSRDVWGHDQTTTAFWRVNQQNGLSVRLSVALSAGQVMDITIPRLVWFVVPKPAESVTAPYVV